MTNEKSIQILELPRVLHLLASHAVSEQAKEALAALRPTGVLSEARSLQEQTSEARALIGIYSNPAFGDIKPVEAALKRADLGGVLNTRELLGIANLCRATRQVKGYGAKDGAGCLAPFFRMLQPNQYLEDKITGCILDEDTIADSASSELASIRRHIRVTSSKIRDVLQKIITSPSYSKILQDTIITQRGDRFVVPVKTEHKAELPGLTHDISSSGATMFIEPMQVVNANNELKELAGKEAAEIQRILAELSADCVGHGEGIRMNYQALVELDIIFARGKFSYTIDGCEPALNDKGRLRYKNARHPLLDKKTAVPISVRLGADFDTLVITGPNTGGKTVTLKTIGLLSLMAACGLHIPVDSGSETAIFGQIMADIGDEQSIEQSLSTFSSHMTNIVSMLDMSGKDTADDSTLMLFDELGAGTDPVEGAALAVAIIEQSRRQGAKVVATTHYAELKVFALTTAGVENASCEFNVETLRPTYRLLIGVPGKSNAFAISKRLGLGEDVIEQARQKIGQESKAFEDVLTKLEAQRQYWEQESLLAAQSRVQAEQDAKKAREARDVLERDRLKSTEKARAEASAMLQEARDTVEAVLSELADLRKKSAKELDYQALNEAKTQFRTALNKTEQGIGTALTPEVPLPPQRPLKIGDTVLLLRTNTKATVLQLPDKNGKIQLQAGLLTVSAKLSEVRLSEEQPQRPKVGETSIKPSVVNAKATGEVDLRGMLSDEGVMVMEQFLDNALLSKLQTVTIIHGKGTGAMRKAVQLALRQNKQVKNFRLGRYGEGEDGVTIVELK